MISYIPQVNQLHDYCAVPYVLRYDLGFISRGFIGTFLGLFFHSFISTEHIWGFIFINQIILIVVVVLFLKIIRKKCSSSNLLCVLYLSILFIVNPSSVAFLFYRGNYGRFDLFMIIGVLICSILIIKNNFLFLIPIICAIEMLIHQGFVFSYFPCILILLYANSLRNKKYGLLIITFIMGSIAFIIMQFFGKISELSLQEVIMVLENRTNFPVSQSQMVELEYFTPILNFIPQYVLPNLKKNILKSIFVVILLLPVELIFIYLFKNYVRIKEDKKLWVMPLFILITIIPKFILTCDYGRDFASVFISLFVLMFTLFAIDIEAMEIVFSKCTLCIKRNIGISIFILFESSIIGKFEAANILEIAEKMFYVFSVIWKGIS